MRSSAATVALLCLTLAACAGKPQSASVAPPIGNGANSTLIGPATGGDPNGWQRFTGANTPRRIVCGELPVLLEGNRGSVTLSGSCGYVRVAGDHNDVAVELAPGGTIEITGAHNDVSWKQPNATIPPSLYNRGASNSFHPPVRG